MENATQASKIEQILRGEISAVEAYEEVMKKVSTKPDIDRFLSFKEDHERAKNYWRGRASQQLTSPPETSGVWGSTVEGIVKSASLLGDKTALRALMAGEEHGMKEYKELLQSDDVSEADKRFIREELMPAQERHIASLKSLLKLH